MLKLKFSLFFLVFLALLTGTSQAISLEEALNIGYKQSVELQSIQRTIEDLKSTITQIEASMGWQINLRSRGAYVQDTQYLDITFPPDEIPEGLLDWLEENEIDEDEFWDSLRDILGLPADNIIESDFQQLRAGIYGTRLYQSGFSLRPELEIFENDPFNFENIRDNYTLNLAASYQIFPQTPSPAVQNIQKTTSLLEQAYQTLEFQKNAYTISVFENYLNLLHLKEQIKINELLLAQAQNILDQTQQQKEIAEATTAHVLVAQMNYNQAQGQLIQTQQQFELNKRKIEQQLSLDPTQNLIISTADNFLIQLLNQAQNLDFSLLDPQEMSELIQNNYPPLLTKKQEISQQEQTINWQQDRLLPQLTVSANFNRSPNQQNITLFFEISYNLFDSGQVKNQIADSHREKERLVADFNQLTFEADSTLQSILNQLAFAEMQLQITELALARAGLEKQLITEQLNKGLVTEQDLEKSKIDLKQRSLDLEKANAAYLIIKLNLANLLNYPLTESR